MAEQHYDGVSLESKQEHILATTVVAFQHHLSEGAVLVEAHLLVLGADKAVDEMTLEWSMRGGEYMQSYSHGNYICSRAGPPMGGI